jgi:hypothetical protein
MYCNKCGHEIDDQSEFCQECGAQQKQNEKHKFKVSRKLLIPLASGILLIAAICTVLLIANNPNNIIINSIRSGNYEKAITCYNKNIKGNAYKENEVNQKLTEELKKIESKFKNNKISYDDAIQKVETIEKTESLSTEASSLADKINDLNSSREHFSKGKEFLQSNNYKDALIEFYNVIEYDPNYKEAQTIIGTTKVEYKKKAFGDIDNAMSNNDYITVVSKISELTEALPDDSDVLSKKTNCYKTIENNSDFRYVKWGMPINQVKLLETEELSLEEKDYLIYETKFDNHDANLIYSFTSDNKLSNVGYIFTEKHTNDLLYIDDYNNILKYLKSMYGQPYEDKDIWLNNLFKDDPQYYGTAIACGHYAKRAKWKYKNEEIYLYLSGDNFEINLGVLFFSNAYYKK